MSHKQDAETDEEKRVTAEAFLSHVTAAHKEKEFYGDEVFIKGLDIEQNVHVIVVF